MHACIGEPGCLQGPAKRICLHLGLASVRAGLWQLVGELDFTPRI